MTKICTNCNGEGLAGAGDKPWLKEGAIKTCGVCNGTGQVPEASNVEESVPAESPTVQVETVDNSDEVNSDVPVEENFSNGSSDGAQAVEVTPEVVVPVETEPSELSEPVEPVLTEGAIPSADPQIP